MQPRLPAPAGPFVKFAIACVAAAGIGCGWSAHDRARANVERGDAYVASGRPEAAVIEYRNAVKRQPRWAEAYRKLGDAYSTLGKRRLSIKNSLACSAVRLRRSSASGTSATR